MPLDLRAEPEQVLAVRSEAYHRMRVPDRDRRQLDPLVAELDRLRLPHLDVTQPHRDGAVLPDRRRICASGNGDRHLRGPGAPTEPRGRDAAAVAGELGHRPIGVPDHDLRMRAVRSDDLDDAVGADAVADVAEPLRELSVERPAELLPLED